jgi:hypothetical protein
LIELNYREQVRAMERMENKLWKKAGRESMLFI